MLWFYKGFGAGKESVMVRDGKPTKAGESLIFRLRAMKARRGRLTPKAQGQLDEMKPVTR
jgi:hypothetical protein